MDFIIDFYKSLEPLDLIIFWGIIVVIILLLIFFLILINKNKKLKKIIVKNDKIENEESYNEDLPIKTPIANQSELTNSNQFLNNHNQNINQEETTINELPEIFKITNNDDSKNINNTIEIENNFIAEEHIMEFNKETSKSLNNIKEKESTTEENLNNINNSVKSIRPLEMPTGPYQRNVLREMSLSQTSPIGLTSPKQKEDKKIELAKDLEESLNLETNEEISLPKEINSLNKNEINKDIQKKENIQSTQEVLKKDSNQLENRPETIINNQEKRNHQAENDIVKKELNAINNYQSTRKTEINKENAPLEFNQNKTDEIIKEYYKMNIVKPDESRQERNNKQEINFKPRQEEKNKKINRTNETKQTEKRNITNEDTKIKAEITEFKKETSQNDIDPRVKELLNSVSRPLEPEKSKSSSEKYLEEVSKKLAEAEIKDEIERTDYELEQEENAIISYKELMEKKDSIQTIDEEEAVISIEELMKRSKQKESTKEVKEDTKLYNLTEEEENDDFIKELKQFRNDL